MDEKYIYVENGKFVVKNTIDGECVIFGIFDSLEDAIELRDELEDYGWPYSKPTSHSLNKIESNIFEENGVYSVSKRIANHEIVFGKFDSVYRARELKHKLLENAWNLNFANKPFKYGRYIRKDKNFIVNRTINGEYINYGSYKFLDEAISRRDELIDSNWNMDESDILFNLGIMELGGVNHNIGKAGRKYIVFKWEGTKCIFLAMLPNLSFAVKFRDKLDLNKRSSSSNIGNYYFDTKYINPVGDYFRVAKVIDGVLKTFGHYRTLDEAIAVRNELMDNNWDSSIIDSIPRDRIKTEFHRYIHKHNDGYTIFKRINGELSNFGFFEELDDALEYRDFLEENNWNIDDSDEFEEEKFDEYIFLKNDGKYYLKNEIDGEMRIFGVFEDSLDAIAARLDCMRANWDLPSISENEYLNDVDSNNPIESIGLDEFDEDLYEEFVSNVVNFPVTVGKSYKNNGWAVKRSYLVDFVPTLPYELGCRIFINGLEVKGKINIHTRLFYSKNELLQNYLKKLHDIDPQIQTRVDLMLDYGNYKISPKVEGQSLMFTTTFSKSFKNGLFAIPRSVSRFIIPVLPYEEECNLLINNIDVKGRFNLEFRFKFSNPKIISKLESEVIDNGELEIILML